MKQAARMRNDTLNEILKSKSFHQSVIDPCLYKKRVENEWIYLVVYVDDLDMACKKGTYIKETSNILNEHFDLIDLGQLKNHPGLQIRNDADFSVSIKRVI